MLCVIQNNGRVLGFYTDSDNPINGHPMSLSRSNRLELCRVRLAYLLTDGRLVLTEPQTLQCSRLTPQQLNSQILGILSSSENRETSPSTKHVVALFKVPRRAQTALTQAVETKDDFNQFRNFRDSEFVCLLQLRGPVVRTPVCHSGIIRMSTI
jgi:hypothetical protein